MNYQLRDYQRQASDAAVDFFHSKGNKNAVIVMPTGAGKSIIIADIASKLGAPTLVFQPSKEILEQNYAKLLSYGVLDCSVYSASLNRKEVSRITFATIGSVRNNPEIFSHFRYVIVDECFPAGSLVDGKPIESIKVGDSICSFNHHTNQIELKRVVGTMRKPAGDNLVKISLSDKTSFICTDNHPIYTKEHGYISPIELLKLYPNLYEENPSILLHLRKRSTSPQPFWWESLLQRRMRNRGKAEKKEKTINHLLSLRKGCGHNGTSAKKRNENRCVLLLSRMRNGLSEKTASNFVQQKRRQDTPIVQSKNEGKQPYVERWDKRKDDTFHEGEKVQRERRKREINQATNSSSKHNWINNRVCNKYSACKAFISKLSPQLQGRFSFSSEKNSNRDRWNISFTTNSERKRQKENRSSYFIRLESIKVYQQGDRHRPKELHPDSYVYNLEVEDNNNYFVNNVLVHNCHLVNPKEGMYKEFLSALKCKVLGLTATPYRLYSNSFGSTLRFITRTVPRVFNDLIYYTQVQTLSDMGFLSKMNYYQMDVIDENRLKPNSTGAEYSDKSVVHEYERVDFYTFLVDVIKRLQKVNRNGILVFTRFITEAENLTRSIPNCAIVTGETPKSTRERILSLFKLGEIKVVANVGVLTTGFDYPELDTIVLARPTMSLGLYYQMVGRGIRPHKNKPAGWVVDLCGNVKRFGKVEDLRLTEPKPKLYQIESNGKTLTNIYY